MNALKIFSFLFFLCWFNQSIVAQETTTKEKVLVFKHKEKDRYRYIKQDKRIKFWVYGQDEKIKGRLDEVRDNTIVVNGEEFN